LSDGTLRTLAIAAIIETTAARHDAFPSITSMCIIEEPENGIAPAYLRSIFDLFEERSPAGQFIFTSHSPYFIDLFDGARNSVTVLRKAADHTEIGQPPALASDQGPDRLTLSEEYATELVG
jgi:predicted ATPase